MIDVNKITSTLAKLPDQQLQQYAQMHKNDPYIMALAMSESNRRKEMRASGQGAMQEQPKVVDQMVAEMAPQQLPEEMGIGQLPAGEMNFAGGGIVAFADGGDVERYQFGGVTSDVQRILQKSPAQRTPQENALLQQAGVALQSRPLGADSGVGAANTFLENLGPRIRNYFTEGASQLSDEELAARPNAGGVMNERILRNIGIDPTAPRSAAPTAAPAADNLSGMDRRLMAGSQPSIASLKAPPSPKADAAPTADTGRKGPAAASTDKAGAKLPGISDLAALRQQILDQQNYQDPAAAGLLELEARERAAAAAERQAIERDAERFKDAYKGRETRLAEREADIGKQKGTNTGLAFLNAGLAIMSTPGGLATAIGKGAQVGTAQFAAGLDKIRSAQERLGEARDRLDDLKLNREETTAKELRAAENNYRRVGIDAQKRTIDGIRMAADVNEKRATDIYSKTVDLTKTMYEQGEANKRAASANRNNQLELLRAVQSDPKLAAAYRAMHGKGEDVMGQYNDFLKANPTLAIDPQQAMTQFLMSKSVFSQLGAPTVTDKAAGPVRKQP
jgi:hypothetical protein